MPRCTLGGAPCESQVASGWFWGMKKIGGFVDEPTWRPKDFKLKLYTCLSTNLMMYVDVDVSYVCLFYFWLAGCGCGCCSNLTTQWSQPFGRWWMYGDCKIHFAKASFCIVANISGAVVETHVATQDGPTAFKFQRKRWSMPVDADELGQINNVNFAIVCVFC